MAKLWYTHLLWNLLETSLCLLVPSPKYLTQLSRVCVWGGVMAVLAAALESFCWCSPMFTLLCSAFFSVLKANKVPLGVEAREFCPDPGARGPQESQGR